MKDNENSSRPTPNGGREKIGHPTPPALPMLARRPHNVHRHACRCNKPPAYHGNILLGGFVSFFVPPTMF